MREFLGIVIGVAVVVALTIFVGAYNNSVLVEGFTTRIAGHCLNHPNSVNQTMTENKVVIAFDCHNEADGARVGFEVFKNGSTRARFSGVMEFKYQGDWLVEERVSHPHTWARAQR